MARPTTYTQQGKAPKRTQQDIANIKVIAHPPGYDGWAVHIYYTDNKMVTFSIDHSNNPENDDMLQLVADSIKKQLEGTG